MREFNRIQAVNCWATSEGGGKNFTEASTCGPNSIRLSAGAVRSPLAALGAPGLQSHHSCLSATMGSTRIARSAGIKLADSATTNRNIELTVNAAGLSAPVRIWLEAMDGARYT